MNGQQKINMEITIGTIFRIVLIILAIFLVYYLRGILAILFVAFIISSAINPVADRLQKFKIPRGLVVIAVYLIVIAFLVLSFVLLVPVLADQIMEFSKDLPDYITFATRYISILHEFFVRYNLMGNLQKALISLEEGMTSSVARVYSTTASFFRALASLAVILVISFYLVIEKDGLKKFLRTIIPLEHQKYVVRLAERLQKKLGKWFIGQLTLMIIIGIADYLVLWALGVKFALILAIFAALMELIPVIGPIVAAIPAVILGLLQSWWIGLLVLVLYIIIQQIENHILVPQIMRKAVGLNPLLTILALLVGAKTAGVLGAVIAVPFACALAVFATDLFQEERETAV